MKLAHRGGVTRMRELIGCYALLGLLWFGYLDEWRVATLWLTLMLLAVSSLRVRRSLLENEPARNAWSGYAGQAGYHFLIAGWKVMAFFVGVGVIQVITIGFGKEDLQSLYSRSKSYLDWVWWLAPLVHSSVLHWLGNVVSAAFVIVAFHRIRFTMMIAAGVGVALLISVGNVVLLWLTETDHVVIGSSAGIAGMIGAGSAWSKRSKSGYPPAFHQVVNVQFLAGFVVLSLMDEPKSALVHVIGWLMGLGLAMVCQPKS